MITLKLFMGLPYFVYHIITFMYINILDHLVLQFLQIFKVHITLNIRILKSK